MLNLDTAPTNKKTERYEPSLNLRLSASRTTSSKFLLLRQSYLLLLVLFSMDGEDWLKAPPF